MRINVKAKSSFYHGNQSLTEGQEAQFFKYEAEDLEKAGLVEIIGEAQPEQAEESGVKMEEAPLNKMADAPANKSRTKKQ